MSDKLKSAYELAMERLADKDAKKGEKAPASLSDAQKERIAGIRQEYEAKLAERRILHDSHLRSTEDPEERERMEDGFRRDREHLESQREIKIKEVRAGGNS